MTLVLVLPAEEAMGLQAESVTVCSFPDPAWGDESPGPGGSAEVRVRAREGENAGVKGALPRVCQPMLGHMCLHMQACPQRSGQQDVGTRDVRACVCSCQGHTLEGADATNIYVDALARGVGRHKPIVCTWAYRSVAASV